MTEPDLLALADRVEALTAPDEETFWEAWRICFPKPERIWEDEDREEWTAQYSAWQERQWIWSTFLEAGAWLDAAMTLVPEGWAIAELKDGIRHEDGPYCAVRLWCLLNTYLGYKYPAHAATPALALTAAALRARARAAL